MASWPAWIRDAAERAAGLIRSLSSPETTLLVPALPALFLHVDLQPAFEIPVGSTDAQVALSDVAVVALALAAVRVGRRDGWTPLRAARSAYVAAAALLAFIAAGTLVPVLLDRDYDGIVHAVTGAKFAEYVLLALAVPLLVRTVPDLRLLLGTLIAWTVAAAAVAVLQFVGAVPELEGFRPGQREPSFVGFHDLAALAGATLAIGLASIALGPLVRLGRAWLGAAVAAGIVGVVLSGAIAGFIGVLTAAAAVALLAHTKRELTRSRALALVAVVATVGAGVFSLRAANIDAFLRFIGVTKSSEIETFGGESYVQRLALGYIGVRTFADHPLLGVGWQATSEEWTYRPYLQDTRDRYPRLPEASLPSPEHPWGVQNAYIQSAAELGVFGALAFLAALLVPVRLAWRAARRVVEPAAAALPMLWLLVTMSVWLGLGIVAGIPLVALMWLSVGLTGVVASGLRGG